MSRSASLLRIIIQTGMEVMSSNHGYHMDYYSLMRSLFQFTASAYPRSMFITGRGARNAYALVADLSPLDPHGPTVHLKRYPHLRRGFT